MATEHGFVYFLGNSCMPGIYKIGFTTNHPKTRLEQLSSSTACPMPFRLVATFGVANPREVEQEIHGRLARHRVNSSREFFYLNASAILNLCEEYGDSSDDLYQTFELEWDASVEEKEAEKRWKIDYFLAQDVDPIFWPKRNFSEIDDIPF